MARTAVTSTAAARAVVVCAALASACGRGRKDADETPSAPDVVDAPAKADRSIDLGDGVSMDFVRVEPGAFTMGADDGFPDEKPAHRVVVAKPFFLARYETTQAQWRAVMGTDPSRRKAPGNPVENVSWNDCRDFVAKLNANLTGMKSALPTEAQWEYACRARSATKWCFGDDEATLPQYAWYLANARRAAHVVGARKPNAWGFYDMHGNVWEWCADAWHESYVGAPTDESAWTDEKEPRRVRRGGSWYDSAYLARSSYRLGFPAEFKAENLGFRVALTVEPGSAPEARPR